MIKPFIVCFLLPCLAVAQGDSLVSRVKYFNTFVSGILIGSEADAEREITASFNTVHGVKFKTGVKAGIGVGLDTYYNLKVFPFTLSFTIDQERKKEALFVQLNSGYSLVRSANELESATPYEKGGFTVNPMIGYRIMIENYRIYWQVGYKFQKAEVGYRYDDWAGNSQVFSRHYELNRFVLQLGFGFQ